MDTLRTFLKNKYLMLVPANESKGEIKNMIKCGVNSDI